jgi:UDP-2,3-diacylglucosamine hydrolase
MSGKVFFLSDFHLGAPTHTQSLEREKKIVQFLDQIKRETGMLFILGDMFDFWFEYRKVVPKGYVRLLAKIAEFSDNGIPVYFFTGNHDMWVKDYFEKELGMIVLHQPKVFDLSGKKFLIGHGDGLGPGDHGYKRLKKIFRNPFCQWLFSLIPPALGIGIADYFSKTSRAKTGISEQRFLGEEKEWLIHYCREKLQKSHYDFFVFGHRHLPIDFKLKENSRYINLGDWIHHFSFAVYDGNNLELKFHKPE